MGRTEKNILFLILLITLVTRLYYVYTSPPLTLTHDEVGYHRMTLQLLDERIMGYYSHTPRAFVTPGYPLFLALAYFTGRLLHIEPMLAGRTFQVIISVFSVLFVYLIARKAGGPRAGMIGAILAAVLAAVYQPSFMANNRILTEVLYTFLLLVYVYSSIIAFEKTGLRWHALSGAILGLAVLVRPTAAPFLIVPYGVRFVMTRDRRELSGLIVAAAAFCLVMSPWWVRNYLVFDKFIMFSTESGNPFLRGTDPYDIYDHKGPSIVKNVPDAEMTKVALSRIREGLRTDPWLWIKWFTVGKLSFLWLKPWGIYSFWARLLHLWVFVILGWMGILAGLFDEKMRWPALFVVFSTLIQMAFIPIERYMYPLTPIMAIMAATLTVKIIQKILDTASLNR
ncbi:MAG: hypothetical protein CVV03_04735 [Firmicutes bacterium HGW-Firmicutes-8]|nr:MAG: hypothetical protein CVV03_04735 [Firmicutes bacterium HGW-Firmicutes-8]